MDNKITRLLARLKGRRGDFMPPIDREFPARDRFASAPTLEGEAAAPVQVPAVKMPKVGKARKTDYAVLTSPAELPYLASKKVLICGHGVVASLDSTSLGEAFIDQPARSTVPRLKAAFAGKKARPLNVAVDARLLAQPKTRYALALDGYLRWAFAHAEGTTVLLGGAETAATTYLDVYVFQDRVLVEVQAQELPGATDPRFGLSLNILIDTLRQRYGQTRIMAAAPLPDWGRTDVGYLGDAPIRGLTYLPLSAKATSGRKLKPAVAAGALGVVAYATALAVGWSAYSRAGERYEAEVADPTLASAGGINNARLEVMQQRRAFMEVERGQEALARRSGDIVAGIASIPGVKIAEISFGAHTAQQEAGAGGAAGEAAPDVTMQLLVPVEGASAVRHAEMLMTTISARTGLKLRLVAGGWNTDDTAGTRALRIEGFTQ